MNLRQKTLLKFILNIIFAIYNCVLGFASQSLWFVFSGAYYAMLSVMRIAVIFYSIKNRKNEHFIMKFTGIMIFVMSLILGGMVYLTVTKDTSAKYHEIAMITIALYAFVKITIAIINSVKTRKGVRPYVKTLRSIALTDAVVSIYSLQRSMLVSFEGMSAEDIILFNILTGTGMCIIVILTGIYLIKENRKMAKSKIVKGIEKISDGVVEGYKKIEKGVVDGYTKIEDKFVDRYLTREGESVEEAKKRLKNQ